MLKLIITIFSTLLLISNSVIAQKVARDSIGNANKGKVLSATCIACHGVDGNSPSNAFPKIAGQRQRYLFKQLKDFKSSKRKNGIMLGIVAPLSEQDMLDLSAYFAKQKPKHNAAIGDEKLIAMGRDIYRGGNIKNNIPACSACHGPKGLGINSAKFPLLSLQYASYTTEQLKAFRQYYLNEKLSDDKKPYRDNDINKIMRQSASELSDTQIKALSQYIAGLH